MSNFLNRNPYNKIEQDIKPPATNFTQEKLTKFQVLVLALLSIITICSIISTVLFVVFAANSNSFKNLTYEILGVEKDIKTKTLETASQLNMIVNTTQSIINGHPNLFNILENMIVDMETDFNDISESRRRKILDDMYSLPSELMDRSQQMQLFMLYINQFIDQNKDIVDRSRSTLSAIYNTSIITQEIEERFKRIGKIEINF